MSARDDDAVWIEARERGEAVGDHPRAAAYARLGRAIDELPVLSGGTAWRDAVLTQLFAPEPARVEDDALARARRRRRTSAVVAASAVALVAILIVVVRPDRSPRPAPVTARVDVQVEAGPLRRAASVAGSAVATRGTAAIGDTLTFAATFARDGALWIYGGDRLVLRCPGAPACSETAIDGGRRLTATVRADAALTYTGWLLEGRELAPAGSLEQDAQRFLGNVTSTTTIDVR